MLLFLNKFKARGKVNFTQVTYGLVAICITVFLNLGLHQVDKYYEQNLENQFIINQSRSYLDLVKNDLENLVENKLADHLLTIKNYSTDKDTNTYGNAFIYNIFDKNSKIIAIDFTNVIDLIEKLANNNFNYCLSINDKILAQSNYDKSYIGTGAIIISNIKFAIKVKPLAKSAFAIKSEQRISLRLAIRAAVSSIIVLLLALISFRRFKLLSVNKRLKEDLINIKEYCNHEIEYNASCYEYSKKDKGLIERLKDAGLVEESNIDYFPLFLANNCTDDIVHRFDLSKLTFCKIADGYNAINQTNIRLISKNLTTSNVIESVLEEEIFAQLLKSIIWNLLVFKKRAKERGEIIISYHDNEVEIKCDLINLNKELLIKWSKSIFHNTGNPYILNFKQIFKIYEIFKSDVQITHDKKYLVFVIKFRTEKGEQNHIDLPENVIKFKGNHRK